MTVMGRLQVPVEIVMANSSNLLSDQAGIAPRGCPRLVAGV